VNAILIPGFWLLAGICGYAAVVHGLLAFRQTATNYTHLLFAGMCFLAIPFSISHTILLQAVSSALFLEALRWNLAVVAIQIIVFVWFIAFYSRVRINWFLYAISLMFVLMFIVNLIQPYTLQYSSFIGFETLSLPWGERLMLPVGENSSWFKLATLLVVSTYIYGVYALVISYRRDRERASLVMLVAVIVYFLLSIEGILVRLGLISFVPLGAFGYLGMIGVMGVVLLYEIRQQAERLQAILDHVPAVVYMKDLSGRYLMINRHYEELFHVANSDIVGKSDSMLFPQSQTEIFRAHEQQAINERAALEFEEIADKQGVPHTYLSQKFPLFNADNVPYAVCGISTDITERKQMEKAIRYIADGVGAETGVAFFQHLVRSLYQLFNADYVIIGQLDEVSKVRVDTLAVCAEGEIVENMVYALADTPCEHVMETGTCVFTHEVQQAFPRDRFLVDHAIQAYIGAPLLDGSLTMPTGIIVMLKRQAMTEAVQVKEILEIFAARAGAELARLKSESQMRDMAYQDYLTRLPNRALLHIHLAQVLVTIEQQNQVGAMLMLDLDHFKTINNALSHDVGDDVLREVGRRLMEMDVANNFIARLGGDEFVMLIESGFDTFAQAESYARDLAEKIMQQFIRPLSIGEHVLNVGASIGVVMFTGVNESGLDVLRHAEMALYRAKGMGRNNVQFYLNELQAGAEEKLRLEDGLRMALANQEFSLYFQPQVDGQGRMIGAEALLRWHHPEMGNIPPSIFIPVAEEAGLIHAIGSWVLDEAVAKLAGWLKMGVPYTGHLSVNVSAWQFARVDFVEQVRQVLGKYQIMPRQLMLEVTETALLYDFDQTVSKLRETRALGVQTSLDDFGTGYSSLAYLKDLPLDELKIDKAFIDELLLNQDHTLVETIMAIGRCMRLKVIAEGVESVIQRDALLAMGCMQFQGYLFSRPLAEVEFLQWIASQQANVAGV
jgi:diguanylate cyclase (GGDEF)-like protein/PAS domain S-box-containing protein